MRLITAVEYLTAGEVPPAVRKLSFNQRMCGHDAEVIPRAEWEAIKAAAEAFYAAHDDAWIEAYNAERRKEDEEREAEVRPPAIRVAFPGHVYLLRADDGHYKIGRTRSLNDRMRQLTIQLPFKVETVHTFFSEDYCKAERELHKRFKAKRVNGEWFKLDPSDVEYIRSLGAPASNT